MYNRKNSGKLELRREIIERIMKRLFQENPEEKAHSIGVSDLSVAIGKALYLSDLQIEKLKMTGIFHDIGKITVKKEILLKEGSLNQDEWREIKRHSESGYIILSSSHEYNYFAEDVLYHHERYDGKGYPKGLKGEDIPLNARILALADAYNAMTSHRPYRKAMAKNKVIDIILEESGKQFDPKLVKVFIELISS